MRFLKYVADSDAQIQQTGNFEFTLPNYGWNPDFDNYRDLPLTGDYYLGYISSERNKLGQLVIKRITSGGTAGYFKGTTSLWNQRRTFTYAAFRIIERNL